MSNHHSQNSRDHELGSALRSLTDPPTRADFWDDLERRLSEVDGDAATSDFAGSAVTDLGSWRLDRGRILLAAAVIILAVGGATLLINPFGDDTTAIDAVDKRDVLNNEADATDDGADNDADDGSASGTTGESDQTPTDPIDYLRVGQVTPLRAGSFVVGASPQADAILTSTPIPDSDGTGCEGLERYELVAQTSTGATRPIPPEAADFNLVIPGPDDRLLFGGQCEESINLVATGSFSPTGDLVVQGPFADAHQQITNLAFLSHAVWSWDGSLIYVNAIMAEGETALVVYDSNTGEILGVEATPDQLLAELVGGIQVVQTPNGLSVGGTNVPLIDGSSDYQFVQVVPSQDRALLAAWSDNRLVIVAPDGTVQYQAEMPTPITDVAWTPFGTLLSVSSGSSDMTVIDPSPEGVTTPVDLGELGSDGWYAIEVADDGRVVAVSGFAEPNEVNAYALTFGDGGQMTADTGERAADENSVGHYPLTLQGMGPIQIGMTVNEVAAAIGRSVDIYIDDAPSDQCFYADVFADSGSPRLMVITEPGADPQTGVIARIELERGQMTASGISIGSTAEEALAVYGDRIRISPNTYTSEDVLTYVPTDSADSNYRLVMETSGGVITAIRAGRLPEVEFVEGCL